MLAKSSFFLSATWRRLNVLQGLNVLQRYLKTPVNAEGVSFWLLSVGKIGADDSFQSQLKESVALSDFTTPFLIPRMKDRDVSPS